MSLHHKDEVLQSMSVDASSRVDVKFHVTSLSVLVVFLMLGFLQNNENLFFSYYTAVSHSSYSYIVAQQPKLKSQSK